MTQLPEAIAPGTPLPPQIHPQAATDVCVEGRKHAGRLKEAKVASPSPEITGQGGHHGLQADAPCPGRQFLDAHLEPRERFGSNLPLAPVVRNAEAQERPFRRPSHRTFRGVDLQLKFPNAEPRTWALGSGGTGAFTPDSERPLRPCNHRAN